MNLTARLITSLVIGLIAATVTAALQSGQWPGPLLLCAFCIATLISTALPRKDPADSAFATGESYADADPVAVDGPREQGKVKWFNVSKGFGFIVKDDGEEIFVHFRSIRGEGRRSLKDGQRVEFTVAQSDKGPQAEDVVALD